jgi:hypothetical protein
MIGMCTRESMGGIARHLRQATAVTSCALLAFGMPTTSHAQMNVSFTGRNVQIVAEQASLAALFSAISAKYPLRYQTSVPLDEPISGSYSGAPRLVMQRLLTNYNYFMKIRGRELEVFVISKRHQPAHSFSLAIKRTASQLKPECC